jgi:hypothetical protein
MPSESENFTWETFDAWFADVNRVAGLFGLAFTERPDFHDHFEGGEFPHVFVDSYLADVRTAHEIFDLLDIGELPEDWDTQVRRSRRRVSE